MDNARILLASASPRRSELLSQIGVPFSVQVADIDETPQMDEVAELYVTRMALEKARMVASTPGASGRLVLGADTSVVVDGQILGKPVNREEGLAMMSALSGRSHHVYTGVALVESHSDGREATRLSVNSVTIRQLSETERMAYWASGEPLDKAGGYAIQGLAAAFISHLEGSFSGVMGLPLFETAELLREFDIDVLGPVNTS